MAEPGRGRSTPRIDGHTLLDPEFSALAGELVLPVNTTTLPHLRVALADMARQGRPDPDADGIRTTDHAIPGSEVAVRVHQPVAPSSGAGRGGIYSMHGGGYVLGTHDMDDERIRGWCRALDCVGFSVAYRLAPEVPYPGPLEDCYEGLRWVHQHHAELGVDPQRVGVIGTSAGGGLAAALAMLARDRGELAIAFQALECPMIDDRQVTPSSRLDHLVSWPREANEFGWRSYLGPRYGREDVPGTAAVARATHLHGLPPALVQVGTADGFCDEDIDYARRLAGAGVPTELHVYPGAPHGAAVRVGTDAARRWNRDLEDWLARQLSPARP
jgi:acetyl esterase/lipase